MAAYRTTLGKKKIFSPSAEILRKCTEGTEHREHKAKHASFSVYTTSRTAAMTSLSLLLASVITELRFPCSFPAVNAVTVHLLLLAWVQYHLAGLAVLQVKSRKVCEHLDSLVSLRNIKILLNAIPYLVTNLPPPSDV